MLIEYEGKKPRIAEDVFIAPTAVLIGDVRVEAGASIWFGAVLRADHGTIVIGAGSSVQDNATLHVPEESFTIVGENVTVGHGAVLEGCRIGARSVIGMNAVVLAGVEIGEEVMIAAGSVVVEGAIIPSRVLAAGAPAKVKKALSGSALEWIGRAAPVYHDLRSRYLGQGIDRLTPHS
jgi:carbonic anhydrase/acetyltransferase-like protein (isoleucine patch superfamily)